MQPGPVEGPAQPAPPIKGATETPTLTDVGLDSGQFLAPPQAPDELGRLGPYRVLKILGAGGMGIVFEAEEFALGRRVALKVMRPDSAANQTMRQRFIQEGKAAAQLQHDHIIPIYNVGEDQGIPYLAMPLLSGQSLDGRLNKEGRLGIADILQIGREAAAGLAAAHDRGLVHRDIKPANIWLEAIAGGRSRVKILDFGLARVIGDVAQHLTQTGFVVGTPGFMAPEQARGALLDGRCDLFSLGCVLYLMCTGNEPFRGSDVMATLTALAMDQPPPIRLLNPDVPPELAELVNWLMAKSPGDRPRSAHLVADSLARIEEQWAKNAQAAEGMADAARNYPSPAWMAEGPKTFQADWVGETGVVKGRLSPLLVVVGTLLLFIIFLLSFF